MTIKRRVATVLAAASLMLSALATPALAGKPDPDHSVPGGEEGCAGLGGSKSDKDCSYADE